MKNYTAHIRIFDKNNLDLGLFDLKIKAKDVKDAQSQANKIMREAQYGTEEIHVLDKIIEGDYTK